MNKIYEYSLTAEGIDSVSEQITSVLSDARCKKEHIYTIRMSAESILIDWMNAEDAPEKFTLNVKSRLRKIQIRIEAEGDLPNPVTESLDVIDDTVFSIIARKMEEDGVKPSYSHNLNESTVAYDCPKKEINSLALAMSAVVCAIVTWSLMLLLPDNLALQISEIVLEPMFSLILDLMAAIAVFLVFLSIVGGLCNVGGGSKLRAYGRILLKNSFADLILITVVTIALSCVMFDTFGASDTKMGSSLSDLYMMIMNIIPHNLISPFLEKNTLQVAFLGMCGGIIVSGIGDKVSNIRKLFFEMELVFSKAIYSVCKIVPLLIYLSVLNVLLKGYLGAMLSAWKCLAVTVLLIVFEVAYVLVRTGIILRTNPFVLLKDSLHIGLNGFMTSSSYSCMGMMKDLCCNKYGMTEERFSFIFAVNQILYKPDYAISFLTMLLFTANIYGLKFNFIQCIILFVASLLIIIATPALPGATLISISALYTMMGIPLEAIAIVAAIDPIGDMIITGSKALFYSAAVAATNKQLEATDK